MKDFVMGYGEVNFAKYRLVHLNHNSIHKDSRGISVFLSFIMYQELRYVRARCSCM